MSEYSKVFTNSLQYKNVNIVICVLAVPFEIYWTTEVSNLEMQSLIPSDIKFCIYYYNMIRIKKETANVWEHTNDNIATIANVVDL